MVVSIIFMFSPTWGNGPILLAHIFQMGWFNCQLNKGPQLVTPGDTWGYHQLHQGLEKTQQALQKRQLEVDIEIDLVKLYTTSHAGWLGHLKGSFWEETPPYKSGKSW